VKPSKGSQGWQITKVTTVLEHVIDSANNRAAFSRAGLPINARIYPLVSLMKTSELVNTTNSCMLPDAHQSQKGDNGADGGRNVSRILIFGFLNRASFPAN
jgi:hypothetical protein